MSGLLINGVLVPVPGLTIVAPASHGGPSWARLEPGDYKARKSSGPHQVFAHTTKGIEKQRIIPGSGPIDRNKRVADYWYRDPEHSAAPLVIGSDGIVVCLGDLARLHVYHATLSNEYSVGFEIYQELDGGIYEVAMQSAVKLTIALCDNLKIPRQYCADPYDKAPLNRMAKGGADCVGVFGHRNNTARRGRGDPGDLYFSALAKSCLFEGLLYDKYQDLEVCRRRQRRLRSEGYNIVEDGLCGPRTLAAANEKFGSWAGVPI